MSHIYFTFKPQFLSLFREFLVNNSFLWAKAPAQSPDLNLSDMKKFVSTKLCKNLEEVQLAIDEYK